MQRLFVFSRKGNGGTFYHIQPTMKSCFESWNYWRTAGFGEVGTIISRDLLTDSRTPRMVSEREYKNLLPVQVAA